MQLVATAKESAEKVNELALARKAAIEKRKEAEEQRLLQAEEEEHNKRVQLARQSEAAEEERRRADRYCHQAQRPGAKPVQVQRWLSVLGLGRAPPGWQVAGVGHV